MIIKIGNQPLELVEHGEFKELVTSLKDAGIDTRPELEVFYDSLDFESQVETSRIVISQLVDNFGIDSLRNVNFDTLWDLFLNLF